MATQWALLADGVVTNVIVCEDGDDTFAHAYVAQDTNDHDTAVNLDSVEPEPGVGWTRQADGSFSPPVPPPVDPVVEAAIQRLITDRAIVAALLTKHGRSAADTQSLLDALARLAGVEHGDA